MSTRYFAFGSNMSSARLQARIPGAGPIGRAKLEGWAFACNKSGVDGSAKANVQRQLGGVVWGVVYELSANEIAELDAFEGGYRRLRVVVTDAAGRELECWAYTSDRLTRDERPFDWYRAVMLQGAAEHELPESYVATLRALVARPSDPT